MGLCVTLRYNITMGCCSNLVRVFLIISNVILAVLGLLTIAGGLWLTFDQNNVKELIANVTRDVNINSDTVLPDDVRETLNEFYTSEYLNYFVIGLGAVSFIVSLFGCCGAKKESVCLLSTYIFFTIVLIILQVTVIVLLNDQDSNLTTIQSEVSGFLHLNLDNIESSHRLQTIFFGASTGLTVVFLFAALWVCKSARNPPGYQETLPY